MKDVANNSDIAKAGLVFILSSVLLVVVQLPTPEMLNPLGCVVAPIAIFSGTALAMFVGFRFLDWVIR